MLRRCMFLLVLALCLLGLTGTAVAETETPEGKHFTLVDEKNRVINQTGIKIYPGDIYIAADNSRYRVVEVIATTARCAYQGKEAMPTLEEVRKSSYLGREAVPVVNKNQKPTIAIYHTHSDESYVPTDGKESIDGNGGIYDVGKALAVKLRAKGFNVIHNWNNHNPHDINAYSRSRRTASTLLRKMPNAIIDVHRDSTPPGEYQTTVKGQDVTKIKLVVGRSNPNSKTNLEFAKRLKVAMDNKTPGLSAGIFMGKGDYNQDLSPRAMLVEVGAHTNTKPEAEEGIKLFAEALPSVLGVTGTPTGEPAQKPMQQNNQGAGTAILIIVIITAVVIGGFFLLNKGPSSKE
ncbi:Sporulation stage II, protein P [Syntrophomonas zehnderi OL-4]|uniref:Sporulation stage II, protein P n=1 Tax=Syntrophomonas zehnderi OL-4 TaxID=690567 RepID=A0A0E4GCR7_9FIRM|nr:stage II sporulation protein P [Syntrophomonas zehnderi]CFX21260.1 Sporulation stage II, protein P [Syntrophomonas zehnderi OL-4]